MLSMVLLAYKTHELLGEHMLLSIPRQPTDLSVDMEKLEDKNTKEYLITYETNKAGTISGLNKTLDAIVKGTNFLYPLITGKQIISGAFFTKAAQYEGRKNAVLNEKAAFELLGSMDSMESAEALNSSVPQKAGSGKTINADGTL
jgi:hypothetical protein